MEMNLTVTKDAAEWYKDELDLTSPTSIRFLPRYGFGGHIPGFSIAISNEDPVDMYHAFEISEITFFVENEDAWYFEDGHLKVQFDEKQHEATFSFEETSDN